ncbi:MAG: serine/threonine-protein kinase, partial [Acidobacteriota bacterium]
MVLSAGDRLGRYEIVGPLGAGGMGEVYRAVDTALAREVAVKVLPDGVADDPSRRERFIREARAVAALSHPNILEIHDVGEENGVHYAVTELLEGQTLRDLIPATGMSWQRVAAIGADIAEALSAAHERGVLHRDIKPDNVFVTSAGRVKVLDFGLARVHEETSSTELTRELRQGDTHTGTFLGDARSDIFALGCVLYEMATGRRAFIGESMEQTLWATVHEDPHPPSSLGIDLPESLQQTISRCLEKSPDARFQSAADLAYSLHAEASGSGSAMPASAKGAFPTRRRLAVIAVAAAIVVAAAVAIFLETRPTGSGEAGEPQLDPDRVVVLPFENRTGDPDQDVIGLMAADWLTQGMPEAAGIAMIASSSAIAAARRAGAGPGAAPAAARLLGAGTLVTGSYYRQVDELQIKAEVAATATGELLHAVGPVSGPIADPMAVVEALRQQVLGRLAGRDPRIAKFSPSTFDAYRELMAGMELKWDKPEAALAHFSKAAELDPDSFLARLETSHALSWLARREESLAILYQLDAEREKFSSFDRLCLDCVLLRREHRYEEALTPLREIAKLDPLNPLITEGLVDALVWTNRPREALAVVKQVGGLKDNAGLNPNTSQALHQVGEHERELEVTRDALSKNPRLPPYVRQGVVISMVVAMAALGQSDEVARAIDDAFCASADFGVWLALQASTELRAHGRPEDAREIAERTLERSPPSAEQPVVTRWAKAVLMTVADRPEDARHLMAELSSEGPQDVIPLEPVPLDLNLWVTGSLGAAAARVGDRATAEEVLTRLDELARPDLFGADFYFRACIEAELGER